MISRGAAGLLWDPGLGKSRATLHAYNILKRQGFVKAALLIAPLQVIYNVWPAEVEKWNMPIKLALMHGNDKDEQLESDADIYLINPNGLPWLKRRLKGHQAPFDMLVIDQSSQFKNGQTQRFKIIRKLLERFKRKYILTGSPAPNGLLDLWSQAFILDGGQALEPYISHYRAQYFYPTGWNGYQWALNKGAEKTIYKKLKPLVQRLDAKDYLDLPPLIVPDPIELTLDEDARQFYDTLEANLIASLGDEEVTAASAAVVINKLRQVTSGAVYFNELDQDPNLAYKPARGGTRQYGVVHNVKIEAIVNRLEELEGKPTLVAYEFRHELVRLLEAMPEGTPFIGGGAEPKAVQSIVARWNRGEIPILLGQPSSMAHGLNLQGAGRAIIWATLPWNLEHYEQLIRRIWRRARPVRSSSTT